MTAIFRDKSDLGERVTHAILLHIYIYERDCYG